jgi:hypothetical protein
VGLLSKIRAKRLLLPLSLAVGSVLLSWTLAFFAFKDIGWLYGTAFLVIGTLTLGSACFYRYRLTREQAEAASLSEEVFEDRQQLLGLQQTLEEDMLTFEKQRQGFETRLMTYHEWAEFPTVEQFAEPDDEPEEVSARDREVLERVQDAADKIIDNFQNDRYSEDGEFRPMLLLNEVIEFIETIARIYQPDSEHPLLETSIESLLKSINHITLQLMFQIEQLPLNLKDYSLSKAYDHIRKAGKVYQAYQSVSPILPYMSYTWQVGRLVLGANPVTMGGWMLGSEIFKRAGRKLSRHYIDRYSLKLAADAIRIVANETAITFDQNYRYRDPSWIYGVELTELVYQFPLSRETLQVALCEVGTLPLRSSYDRIFLYRCLATGKSPQPDDFVRANALGSEQRREIAERLERFFRVHVHGRRRARVEEWVTGASERLGVQIRAQELSTPDTPEAEAASALQSLGAFLIAVKEMEPDQVRAPLEKTEVAAHTTAEAREQAIQQVLESPPMFFDYADLEPDGAVLTLYLHDLVAFESTNRPVDLQGYWAIQDVAAYCRQDWASLDLELQTAYRIHFTQAFDDDAPKVKFDKQLLLALPRVLEPEEAPLFVYGKVATPSAVQKRRSSTRWLIGTATRLVAVEIREDLELDDYHRHRVFWTAKCGVAAVEHNKAIMDDHCRIQGGIFASGIVPDDDLGLRVNCEKLKSSEKFFRALKNWAKE